MIKSLCSVIVVALLASQCNSGSEPETINLLEDSSIANLPDCNLYYCDTHSFPRSAAETLSIIDSASVTYVGDIPCVNSLVYERRLRERCYIFQKYNCDANRTWINHDTFFITKNMNWYRKFGNQWELLFSESSFGRKEKITLHNYGYRTSRIEEWTPDTVKYDEKYGLVYSYELTYPLSVHSNPPAKLRFSPQVGLIEVDNKGVGFTLSKVDTLPNQ